MSELYQVMEIEGKGFGCVATRDIQSGTLILSETPQLIFGKDQSLKQLYLKRHGEVEGKFNFLLNSPDWIKSLVSSVNKMSETDRTEYLKLHSKYNEQEMKELKITIESLKSEGESSSTEYWESVQELTTELQAKDEEIARNETITEILEENIESMKIDIESSKMKIQELEHEIFEKDILVGDLRAQITSHTELLNGNENEMSTKEQLISSLQSKLHSLESHIVNCCYALLALSLLSFHPNALYP